MGLHEMNIMDRTGHTSINWNPNNPAEVATAEAAFDTMTEQGYRAFRMDGDNQGKRLDEFDRTAAKIMFVPQLRGG